MTLRKREDTGNERRSTSSHSLKNSRWTDYVVVVMMMKYANMAEVEFFGLGVAIGFFRRI
jgi:hypothetical protein